MDLKNKTVLITGAALRIGRAMALGFAEKGAHVLITYKSSKDHANELVAELKSQGCRAQAFKVDLIRAGAAEKLAHKVLKQYEAVDILVNNASIFSPSPLNEINDAEWDDYLALHIKAPFFLAQVLGPAMKKHGGGHIINIADWRGLHPTKNFLAYSISKAGLIALTEGLAKELAPEVLVNAILPGPILPPRGVKRDQQKKLIAKTLLKRWGKPEDIVRQVLFLAEQDYSTGHCYYVDGGESLG